MNQKIDLPCAAEELTMYAAVRLVGFEQHRMGDGFHQPEVRNEWVRDILRGMAEVCGEDAVPLLEAFDQRLEDASRAGAVGLLSRDDQKHTVQSLRQYVSALGQTEGDHRRQLFHVKKLLEDMTGYLPWDVEHAGVYPARDEVEQALLRAVAQRPIRFTRVLIGGETGPGGEDFVSGTVTDTAGVQGTELFARLELEHPKVTEWPAICTAYFCGGQVISTATRPADDLDMRVIRGEGRRFLDRPEVSPVWPHELRVPVREEWQESEPEPEGFTFHSM